MTPTEKDARALAVLSDVVAMLETIRHSGTAKATSEARAHLASRIAELEQSVRLITEDRECYAAMLARAEAELAAGRVNADRYVWLRDKALYAEPDAEGLMTWCVRGRGNGHQYPEDGAALDAAVDASRGGGDV